MTSRSRSPRSRELDSAFDKGKQNGFEMGYQKGCEEICFEHGFFKGHYESKKTNNKGGKWDSNNDHKGKGPPRLPHRRRARWADLATTH